MASGHAKLKTALSRHIRKRKYDMKRIMYYLLTLTRGQALDAEAQRCR